jgi:Holliday junction resolvase RusA-like endonuclease
MLRVNIGGKPTPQKQTRFGKGHTYDPSHKEKKTLQQIFRDAMEEQEQTMMEGPVHVSMHFTFLPPKSLSGVKKSELIRRAWHIKKPDADNLGYLISNSMKNIVYKDDSQVCGLSIFKRYGPFEGVAITVREAP